jgi:hypothetical protein
MAWTVAAVESEMLGPGGRLSGWVAQANQFTTSAQLGIDPLPTVTDGTNALLRGPIRKAMGYFGFPLANPPAVADADLAPHGWGTERFLDVVTLETFYTLLGRLTGVDMKAGENQQLISQYASALRAQISDLESRLNSTTGPNTPGAAVGTSRIGVPMPNDPFNPRSRSCPWTWPYPATPRRTP